VSPKLFPWLGYFNREFPRILRTEHLLMGRRSRYVGYILYAAMKAISVEMVMAGSTREPSSCGGASAARNRDATLANICKVTGLLKEFLDSQRQLQAQFVLTRASTVLQQLTCETPTVEQKFRCMEVIFP
jgi:hypothetical protein